MAFYLSPSVNVREVDLSTSIGAVATSIACIVLRDTYKGPELKQQLVTNEDQLIDVFGYPTKRNYDIDGVSLSQSNCVQDIFSAIGYLKYGNTLYCTRVMAPSATFAGVSVNSSGTYTGDTISTALTLHSETLTSGDIDDPDDFHTEGQSLMGTDDLRFIAYSRGYWGNNLEIALIDRNTQRLMLSGDGHDSVLDYGCIDEVKSIDTILEEVDDLLIIVKNTPQGKSASEIVEYFNVSLDENAVDSEGQSRFIETINDNSNYIRIAIKESLKNTTTVDADWVTEDFVSFTGGSDYNDDTVDDSTIQEGYELYENAEEIDINLFIDSNKSTTVKSKIIEICEARLDAMGIFDVAYAHVVKNKGSEVTDMISWRKGYSSPNFNKNTSYASLYGNWFNVYDKWNKVYSWVPVSGYMAGLFARTDNLRDPWWAPAGLNRAIITGVRKIAFNPTRGERDLMYKNGLNPIISLAGQGKVTWGQKTMLNKDSAFNRINVRRLFIVLEKAISTSSKWFLFEQNDRYTWAQLKAMIEPFLRDIKARRGIYDFYVQIDGVNNTSERIDRNELWVNIFIKPTKTAEFIILQFIATKTGVDFNELIGSV